MAEKKKTSKKKTKKKVTRMSQTHGMVEGVKYEPTTLDQVWGDDGASKYKTLDSNVYKRSLKEMSKSDMQSHAMKIGLIPIDDQKMLESRLIREFNRHVTQHTKPLLNKKLGSPIKIDEKAAQTLREGR